VGAVLAFLLLTAGSKPSVRIDLVLCGQVMPAAVANAMIDEVTAVWAPYGVDIRAVHPSGETRAGSVRLTVTIAGGADSRLAGGALGSIDFVGDAPGTSIVLYAKATTDLVSEALLGHDDQWPAAMHDRVLGRVMGRALAHEVGHFLLRTRGHSSKGLMRAQQPMLDLIQEDRRYSTLPPDDVLALQAAIGTTRHTVSDRR